jgi:hypothetical protein
MFCLLTGDFSWVPPTPARPLFYASSRRPEKNEKGVHRSILPLDRSRLKGAPIFAMLPPRQAAFCGAVTPDLL